MYMCVWGPKVDIALPWLLSPFTIQGLLPNTGASTVANMAPGSVSVPWELGLLVDLAFMLLMGTQTPVFTLTVCALSIEPSHLFCLLSLFIFFNSNYFALYVAVSWVSGESHMRYYWQPFIPLKQNFTWFLDYVLDCHIPVREGIWRVLVYLDFFSSGWEETGLAGILCSCCVHSRSPWPG